jgi:hypothetical protein
MLIWFTEDFDTADSKDAKGLSRRIGMMNAQWDRECRSR